MNKKIWFITGISSGLGKSLAEVLMNNDYFVIGTFRDQSQVDNFNSQYKGKALALKLDVTNVDEIYLAVESVLKDFGKIDVLVNNAGFGFAGAIEETKMEEVREVFETNFFGVLEITKAFLPVFRKQQFGHIIQISSHGGFKAFPGFGVYNASKFAVEGFSEALASEIAPFNVKLTIVEPGPFRTNFAGRSFRLSESSLSEYSSTSGAFKERMKQVDGKQEGDPLKAAEAIIKITQTETPPLRLPLGKISIASILSKIENVQHDINLYREIAESAVF